MVVLDCCCCHCFNFVLVDDCFIDYGVVVKLVVLSLLRWEFLLYVILKFVSKIQLYAFVTVLIIYLAALNLHTLYST